MSDYIKNKTIIQNDIVDLLIKNKGGLCILPTGVGKTRIAIKFIDEIKVNKILIVTSTEKLRDITWPEEFKKWSNDVPDNVTIICYASLHKHMHIEYDAVIFDEIHHVTMRHLDFYAKSFTWVVGLTATPPKDYEKKSIINSILELQTVVSMSVEDAIELNLISPYCITKVEIELDSITKNVIGGSKKKPFLTTEAAQYSYLTRQINFNKNINWTMYSIYVKKRLHFINTLKSKTSAALQILDTFDEQTKTIIFSKSINSANTISPHAFHSKTKDNHLTDFINDKINVLSCVNALNEGITIPNVDAAIIAQLNSNDLILTQQLGRIIRFRENFIGSIYIIVAKNTVDEDWFASATSNLTISNVIAL